jgi:adenylate cyclase
VSVLFADVAGSMELAEGLDAEEWAAQMDRLFSSCAEAVASAGGTVDKFTGDGIMAVFGAPVAQEDHARRACMAALRVQSAATDLKLPVRVGINSGEVVSGAVGDESLGEHTAVGHTVGMAQRMESLAEVGGICLSEATARLVAVHFEVRECGVQAVKGSSEPVGTYTLIGARSLARPAAGIPTPFVGREAEFAVLEDALSRAEAGQAQVVGVVGEAGVGKSRLSEEFASACAARAITVRRTAGLSHATDVALLPVVSLLRDAFGVTGTDGPVTARERIGERLTALDPDLVDALPLLFDFLEVPDPERPAPRLAPDVRQRQVFAVLRRVTQRRSEREVLVLLLEDLHWFDAASRSFLDELIPTFPGSRTLVLTNFRPEFTAAWMTRSYYRQVALAPLTAEPVHQLVGALVGADPSVAGLAVDLLARTGGNPFFLEEVVRSLAEDGTLAGDPGAYRLTHPLTAARVPGTVHAVLDARIDRLPAGAKDTLQAASVIGRTFPMAVLERVAGRRADLGLLCASEFIQADGDEAYRFWHPLTQEVAYRSLLAPRRRQLHAGVAEALAALDPDRLDEQAAVIAGHFAQAGDGLNAARFEDRAARWAQRRSLGEAAQRWSTALAHLATVPETTETLALAVRTGAQLLRSAIWAGLSPEARATVFDEAKAAAKRLGDVAALAMLYTARAVEHFTTGAVADALAYSREAFELACRAHEPNIQAVASLFMASAQAYVGPIDEALASADQTLAITEDDPNRGAAFLGCSVVGRTWHMRAELLLLAGRPAQAHREMERALALHRERRELAFIAFEMPIYGRLSDLTGTDHDAEAHADEAARLAEESGAGIPLVLAREARGVAALLAGRLEDAAAELADTLDQARDRELSRWIEPSLLAYLARARQALGDEDSARATADEAVAVARRQGARISEVLALLVRGRVCGDGHDLRAALALAAMTGAIAYEPFCLEELARLDGDRAALVIAADRFAALGADGHHRRLTAELSLTQPP